MQRSQFHQFKPNMALSLSILFMIKTTIAFSFQATSVTSSYFNGWFIEEDSLVPVDCAQKRTWSSSGTIGSCCPSTSGTAACPFATSCEDRTIYYADDSSYACEDLASTASCVKVTVYGTYPTGSPQTNFFCESSPYSAITLYRTFTSSDQTAPPTSTPTDEPLPDSSDDNRAWIAGAVIGPIAAIGLAFLAFWYGRRSAHQRASENVGSQSQNKPAVISPFTAREEMDDTSLPHELPSSTPLSELQSHNQLPKPGDNTNQL